MLLPESMSRIVIVGTKTRMEDAINAFYSEKAIHVIDHTTGDDGLSIGSPIQGTSKASERLLKIKAMEKSWGSKRRPRPPTSQSRMCRSASPTARSRASKTRS